MNSIYKFKIYYSDQNGGSYIMTKPKLKDTNQKLKFEMLEKNQIKIKSKIFGYQYVNFEDLFPELAKDNYIPIDLNGDQSYNDDVKRLEFEINGYVNSPRATILTSNKLFQLNRNFLFRDITLNRLIINNKIIIPSFLDNEDTILQIYLDIGIKNMKISLNVLGDNIGDRYVDIYFSNVYNTWRIYDHNKNITDMPIVFYQIDGMLKCDAKDSNFKEKTYDIIKMEFDFNGISKNINLQNFMNNYKKFIQCRGEYWKILLDAGKKQDIDKFMENLDKVFNFSRNFLIQCTSSIESSIILECN